MHEYINIVFLWEECCYIILTAHFPNKILLNKVIRLFGEEYVLSDLIFIFNQIIQQFHNDHILTL